MLPLVTACRRRSEVIQLAAANKSYDVVVIGAGHNGLTAAAYLAAAGLSTLVLERRPIVGGCCVTEETFPPQSVAFADTV